MSAVRLTLEPPQPQRRATVAFRLILGIPHLLLLSVLGLVAVVLVILAWFAALFTATVPEGIHRFLANVLHFQARAYGYLGLLTDRYPPFDLAPDLDYAVEVEIDRPDQFNRAAVFFRFFLMLWAHFVLQLVSAGIVIVLFFLWLVTLVGGRMPTSGHLAVAAALRYQVRTYAYTGLLTTEYPHGLFGDKADADDGWIAARQTSDLGFDTAPSLPSSPRITSLVLTTGAKVLLAIALVFGLGAQGLSFASTFAGFGDSEKLLRIDRELTDAYDAWETDIRQCTISGTPRCEQTVDARFNRAVQRATDELFGLEVPESALDEGSDVLDDLFTIDSLLSQLSETAEPTEQLRLRFLIEDEMRSYDEHFSDFYDATLFG